MIPISIPGSKSITQRALICASLAKGISYIENPLFSEDTFLLMKGLKKIGIRIEIKNKKLVVWGNGKKFCQDGEKTIFMGNNGTGLRFLTTLAGFYPNKILIACDDRMENRPIYDLVNALQYLGFEIFYKKKEGFPPILINHFRELKEIVKIKCDKSSQFLSSLLLSGVLFKKGLKIEIIDNFIVSKHYINLTLDVIKRFEGNVIEKDNFFIIKANSFYKSKQFKVESDFSSASYFIAASFISNQPVKIFNLNYFDSLQGDKYFIDIVKKMGGNFILNKDNIEIFPSKLKGISVDMNKLPDMVPTLAILAVIAEGETIIENISHLKYKETDRIKAIEKNMKKLGVNIESGENFIKIAGAKALNNCNIDPENDHRIAMSFSLLALMNPEIKISNKECVDKSFPSFWEEYRKFKLV